MKIFITSILLLISSYTLQAQVSAEYICTQFLAPSEGGVFRGLDFSMSDVEIERVEGERNNMNLIANNIEDANPSMNYRLNLSVSNYAKVTYDLGNSTLNSVTGLLYVSNESTAIEVINYMSNFYFDDLGSPQLNEDGSTSFTGNYHDADITIKLMLMKDGSKNYVSYFLTKN